MSDSAITGAFDIAVAIPSLNESDTIGRVVAAVDHGLQEFFPDLRAAIVNVDSCSADGTRERFLGTPTASAKTCLTSSMSAVGKGHNIFNFLRFALGAGVVAAATVDADLQNIVPAWVGNLLSPVVQDGYDLACPLYTRHRLDGTATNLLCYPVVHGLFGVSLRQPIGGEYAMSARFLRHMAAAPWPPTALAFGVDIFLATEAIGHSFKVCSVELGQKIHRARERASKGPMTLQVAHTLFSQVLRHREYLQRDVASSVPFTYRHNYKAQDWVPTPMSREDVQRLFVDGCGDNWPLYRGILSSESLEGLRAAVANSQATALTAALWCDVVYSFLRAYGRSEEGRDILAGALLPLFFGRMLHHAQEMDGHDDLSAEHLVQAQADLFRRDRWKVFGA